jgi:hypothetical protein
VERKGDRAAGGRNEWNRGNVALARQAAGCRRGRSSTVRAWTGSLGDASEGRRVFCQAIQSF